MNAPAKGSPPVDLLVAGGGPAGSVLAMLGARAGLRVRLLDASSFPRPKACGGVLSPRAVAILGECGLLAKVRSAGAQPISSIEIVTGRGERARLPYGAALALARERLDLCLLEAAAEAGAQVWTQARVEAVEPGLAGRRARVRLRTPTGSPATCEALWVAGAGGHRCPVRRQVAACSVRPWRQGMNRAAREAVAISAVLEGEAAPTGVCEMHLLGDGYCGVAAAGGGRTTVGMVLPARAWRRLGGSPAAALSAALAGRATLGGGITRLPVASGPWVSGSLRARPPAEPPAGILLVGDALARMEPISGEGMAEALESARRAALWLEQHPAPPEARLLHRAQARSLRGARRRSALAAAISRSPIAVHLLTAWACRSPSLAETLGRAIGEA